MYYSYINIDIYMYYTYKYRRLYVFIYLYIIWLRRVLVAACGIFDLCCSTQDLFNWGTWNLGFLTRDGNGALCIGSLES